MNGLSYKVNTPVFEGPLDLLLDLVSKRKLFINDVSLASVTDDFIAYIEQHDEFPLGESAEFIVVASTLMLIKSRSLLPQIQLTEEEDESIQDLEHRLTLYARTKELAARLREIYGKEIIFEKTPSKSQMVVFSPDSKTDPDNLLKALEDLITNLPKKEVMTKAVVQKVATLEETIEKLAERITAASKMSFKTLYDHELGAEGVLTHEKKVSIIVGFLAMLELVRRGLIRVNQETGGDIEMERELEITNHQ